MKKNKLKDKEIKEGMHSVINLLMLENTILRKKLNHEKLTQVEEAYDNFFVPVSVMLKDLKKSKNKGE